jgi:hypothetical protein
MWAYSVDMIEANISPLGCYCMLWGLRMYLWISRREHALSGMRAWCPSLSSRFMAASSAMLLVCVGGVEVTNIWREVCKDERVSPVRRGAENLFF